MSENHELEALVTARLNIANASTDRDMGMLRSAKDGLWDFDEWTACTCGHIYLATVDLNKWSFETGNIIKAEHVDGLYESVMKLIAEANPDAVDDHEWEGDQLAYIISDATTRQANVMVGYPINAPSDDRQWLEPPNEEAETAGVPRKEEYSEEQRAAALVLIDNTIAMVTTKQREAMEAMSA